MVLITGDANIGTEEIHVRRAFARPTDAYYSCTYTLAALTPKEKYILETGYEI
ncbi:hypothetical protein HOLleu_36793 [Holothuria leucospilota]|uniref:Uncharacterized protein n=1 Tax=Holothuria leucospilota TaxID=206669 RepID=A0A9Q0YPR8_HOLLE|nr:hypothetical protein HOLleu_36793 [Holothuria leucospilota]